MGKAKQTARREQRERHTEELRRLKAARPELTVLEFDATHLRLIGKISVDYWPSTGRAWKTDNYDHRSEVMTPAQAVELACEP
jgi:hypothetical protein